MQKGFSDAINNLVLDFGTANNFDRENFYDSSELNDCVASLNRISGQLTASTLIRFLQLVEETYERVFPGKPFPYAVPELDEIYHGDVFEFFNYRFCGTYVVYQIPYGSVVNRIPASWGNLPTNKFDFIVIKSQTEYGYCLPADFGDIQYDNHGYLEGQIVSFVHPFPYSDHWEAIENKLQSWTSPALLVLQPVIVCDPGDTNLLDFNPFDDVAVADPDDDEDYINDEFEFDAFVRRYQNEARYALVSQTNILSIILKKIDILKDIPLEICRNIIIFCFPAVIRRFFPQQ